MDENNRNFLLAVILSIGVLFAWQYFFAPAPPQPQPKAPAQQQAQPGAPQPTPPGGVPATPSAPPAPQTLQGQPAALTREEALKASSRVPIDTPSLKGSIALKGGRIDDLMLKKYRETVEPSSPNVVLLSPAGSPHPYYAERGFASRSDDEALPNPETVWTAPADAALAPQSPVTLTYDNGKGLLFTRTISVDDNYMFTIDDKVENKGADAVTVYPYGVVYREGLPPTTSYYILHEGLIGVFDSSYEPLTYKKAAELKGAPEKFSAKTGWLGITDKYWATVVVPQQDTAFNATFVGTQLGSQDQFRADYVADALHVAPGASAEAKGYLFAGAKEVHVVDSYGTKYGIPKFDLLIDWGWFYFLTRPMFYALDFFYKLVGNFGVSILVVTLLIKLFLFPLANKSYVSMSKMKKLQPELQRIKDRYGDDRMRQQQAMMELYKKEQVNPASGCLPILVQIPVFFALYKVLFVTIEMRQAPFFGWIKDLSAPDPTTIFNLFGLIPWHPPEMLMIGVWPVIMGITMWVQMKLNPAPPDPVQQKMFAWMPVFFTFLLARFPAGLVIYWAWNNFLSVIQQSVIMTRQGVEIALFENLGLKKGGSKSKAEEIEAEAKAENPKPHGKRRKKSGNGPRQEAESAETKSEG
jgi:YidC/Oxa1 family membrane protein insertase